MGLTNRYLFLGCMGHPRVLAFFRVPVNICMIGIDSCMVPRITMGEIVLLIKWHSAIELVGWILLRRSLLVDEQNTAVVAALPLAMIFSSPASPYLYTTNRVV